MVGCLGDMTLMIISQMLAWTDFFWEEINIGWHKKCQGYFCSEASIYMVLKIIQHWLDIQRAGRALYSGTNYCNDVEKKKRGILVPHNFRSDTGYSNILGFILKMWKLWMSGCGKTKSRKSIITPSSKHCIFFWRLYSVPAVAVWVPYGL